MDLQGLINAMNEAGCAERANYGMTLGRMTRLLEGMDPATEITGIDPGSAHSYRGHYSDLAFEPGHKTTAGDLLSACMDAEGTVFEGYKGGDFRMGGRTPLWLARYGCCGDRIMGIGDDGSLVTQPELDD